MNVLEFSVSIVFCCLIIPYSEQGATFCKNIDPRSCSTTCFDYHRLCPAVKNESFLDDYKAKQEKGLLGEFELGQNLPSEVDCSASFWQLRCPNSCGVCTSCWVAVFNGIERKLAIESATASEGMSYYSDITAAFDGRRGTRKDCFVSLSKSAGWAEFHVPFSMISRVVTNIGYWTNKAYRISVCQGKENCVDCDSISLPEGREREDRTSNCPKETCGDTVRFTQDNGGTIGNYLQLCEVEVYGRSDHNL